MMYQTPIVALVVALCAASSVICAPSDAPIDCSKVDELLQEAQFGQGITTNDKWPMWANDDEWKTRCAVTSDAVKTLKRVNKECFSGLTQQVFSTILRSRQQMMELACKPDAKEFKESVELGKCIKENALSEARDAERKALATSVLISQTKFASDHERMQRSCCSVPETRKAIAKAVVPKCGQHEAIMRQHADSYMSEAFGLICADLDKLECDKLAPLNVEGVETKSSSFIVPILKAVKQLDHN